MEQYIAEFIGTFLLCLVGDASVAGVVLSKNKSSNAGWWVISGCWGFVLMFVVLLIGPISGAHVNPAVTIALAVAGKFAWGLVPGYIIAQLIGGILGGVFVWLAFLPHWAETESKEAKLAVFCTGPQIRNTFTNFLCEAISTFVLMFCILISVSAKLAPGLPALFIGILLWMVIAAFGGPTGTAVNPARDLGPRIAHAILPIANKGGSDWSYSWIPVFGPIVGAIVAALFFFAVF
ncbi:MAG: MIP/aquaporin family protein [Syntrophomonas sp.]